MKVLVVGKGGREHALVWKLARSPRVTRLYAAPGSPGIARQAECREIRVDTPASQPEKLAAEILRLREFAVAEKIDLTVVGPEDVLAAGIVDRFREAGLRIFGPTAAAARLESDKAFAKELMAGIGVPTARHRVFSESGPAIEYIRDQGAPIVVKATGLAAGKGAIVARTEEDACQAVRTILDDRAFGTAGNQVVVEEFMQGEEASMFCVTDGAEFVTLVTAQDHKAVLDGDQGPNTGGMGAYAPAPVMSPSLVRQAEDEIIRPVLAEMRRRGSPFQGVLYAGLMIGPMGPRVVEFNCRFGDPEAQVILPLLETDLVDLLEAACDGRLGQVAVRNAAGAAVCVVMASGGYPGSYQTGKEIRGLEELEDAADVVVFHAGTAQRDGRLVTAGGRVLGVTAVGGSIAAAVQRAYAAVARLDFEQAHFRHDIAHRALR
ncbi:MAG: phosphoribosylamine--glycine ligase [Candidatus Latescibacterota bacterium]|jgi:phosphoribosylamine--glycine ligase